MKTSFDFKILSVFLLPSLGFLIDLIIRFSFLSGMKIGLVPGYLVSFIFELAIFYFVFLLLKALNSKIATFLISLIFTIIQLVCFGHYFYYGAIPNSFSIDFTFSDFKYAGIVIVGSLSWIDVVAIFALAIAYSFAINFLLGFVKKTHKLVSVSAIVLFSLSALILNSNVKKHPGNFGVISNTFFTSGYVIKNRLLHEPADYKPDYVRREVKVRERIKTKPKYNVVFVLSESVRQKSIHYYGYQRDNSPFLDSLVKNKKVIPFTRHFSNTNITRFSVPYIMSGAITKLNNPKSVFISDYLKNWLDINTYYYSAQSYKGFRQYFDTNTDEFLELGNSGLLRYNDNGFNDHDLVSRFDQLTGRFDSSRNFYCLLQFNNTHAPYKCEKEFEIFNPASSKPVNAYDNSILEQDFLLRQIFSVLNKRDLLKSTIVIFTSDHGECFKEHGHYGHLNCLYNEETLVPMWIYVPQSFDSITRNMLVENSSKSTSHLDILPTILDFCGVNDTLMLTNKIQGNSLLRSIPPDRIIPMYGFSIQISKALVFENHKLIIKDGEPNRLFDETTDYNEKHNLWQGLPESDKTRYLNLVGKYLK